MHLALAATIGLPKNKQTDKNYTKNQLLGSSSNNNLVENYVQYIYNCLRGGKEICWLKFSTDFKKLCLKLCEPCETTEILAFKHLSY